MDTLPEGRPPDSKQRSEYRRGYHDWKPSVEKTDVFGTMEAIEGTVFYQRYNGIKMIFL